MNSQLRMEGQVLTGQPPIVGGEGGSALLARDACFYGDTLGEFGSRIEEGFCFLFDMQSDSFEEQIILGSGVTGRTAFRIRLHADGVPNRIETMLRDDEGKVLAGYAETSASRAKRLMCTADPRSNLLAFFELQPWADGELPPRYTKQEGPVHFSNLTHPLLMGGWNVDGHREGCYIGRMANVAMFNRWFTWKATKGYRKASTNPTNVPLLGKVAPPTVEQLLRLDADIKRLRKIAQKPLMVLDDFFDSSIILYRWFLDTHPMIKNVYEAYGIQLWFYGKSDRERAYSNEVLADAPTFYQTASFGSQNIFGFKWIPLEAFLQEESFFVDKTAISHHLFIEIVRNKLGGAHYDEDRTAGQRKFLELANQLQLANQQALYYQMHQLVRGVMEALKACGVPAAIQATLYQQMRQTM